MLKCFDLSVHEIMLCSVCNSNTAWTSKHWHRGYQPFSDHVRLQHSDRWTCTHSVFRQMNMNMYPWNFLRQNIISRLITNIF